MHLRWNRLDGELTALPQTAWLDLGAALRQGEKKRKEREKGEKGKREGKKEKKGRGKTNMQSLPLIRCAPSL